MSMQFIHYKIPFDCPLNRRMGISYCFIVYNPLDGETAFFEVDDHNVVPFGEAAMQYVKERHAEWCKENQVPWSRPAFNVEAHKEFMRSL